MEDLLSKISPQVVVSLLTVVITAIVTLASIFVNNFLQIKKIRIEHQFSSEKEKVTLTRNKLELLYETFSKWQNDIEGLCLAHIGTINGKMSNKDAMEIGTKNQLSSPGDFQKIEMLVSIYCPPLQPMYEDVLEARSPMCKVLESEGTLNDYIKGRDLFNAACTKFKDELSKHIQKL